MKGSQITQVVSKTTVVLEGSVSAYGLSHSQLKTGDNLFKLLDWYLKLILWFWEARYSDYKAMPCAPRKIRLENTAFTWLGYGPGWMRMARFQNTL